MPLKPEWGDVAPDCADAGARLPALTRLVDPGTTSQGLVDALQVFVFQSNARKAANGGKADLTEPSLLRDGVQIFDIAGPISRPALSRRFEMALQSLPAYKRDAADPARAENGEELRYSFTTLGKVCDPAIHHDPFVRELRETVLGEIEQDLRAFVTRYNASVVAAESDIEERANDRSDPSVRLIGPGKPEAVRRALANDARKASFNDARVSLQHDFRQFLRVQLLYDSMIAQQATVALSRKRPERAAEAWLRSPSGDTVLRGWLNLGERPVKLFVLPSSHMLRRGADLAGLSIAVADRIAASMMAVTVRPGQLVLFDSALVHSLRLRETVTKKTPEGFAKRLFGFALLLQTHNDWYSGEENAAAATLGVPPMSSGTTEQILSKFNAEQAAYEEWAGASLVDAVKTPRLLPPTKSLPARTVALPFDNDGDWPLEVPPSRYGARLAPYTPEELQLFKPQAIHTLRIPNMATGVVDRQQFTLLPRRKAAAESARGLQDERGADASSSASASVNADEADCGADARTQAQVQRRAAEFRGEFESALADALAGATPVAQDPTPELRRQQVAPSAAADDDDDDDDGDSSKRKRSQFKIGAVVVDIDGVLPSSTRDVALAYVDVASQLFAGANDVFTLLVREAGQLTLREKAAPGALGTNLTIEFGPELLAVAARQDFERAFGPADRIRVAFATLSRFLGAEAPAERGSGLAELYNIASIEPIEFAERHENGVVPVKLSRNADGQYVLGYDELYWRYLYYQYADADDRAKMNALALQAAGSLFAEVLANQVGYADVWLDIERWASRHVDFDPAVDGDLVTQIVKMSLVPGDSFVRRVLSDALTGSYERATAYLPSMPRADRRPYVYANEEYDEFKDADFKLQVVRVHVDAITTVLIARLVLVDRVSPGGLVTGSFIKLPPGAALFDLSEDGPPEFTSGALVLPTISLVRPPDELIGDYLNNNSRLFRESYNATIKRATRAL